MGAKTCRMQGPKPLIREQWLKLQELKDGYWRITEQLRSSEKKIKFPRFGYFGAY